MIKFTVEENVSEYLDIVYERYNQALEYHLKDLARILTGNSKGKLNGSDKGSIGLLMAKWNPNLYSSGQEEDRWLIEKSSKGTSISVNYTGMTYQRRFDEYEFKVWWEFSEEIYSAGSLSGIRYIQYRMDPEERTLKRDYAYYQETGYDRIADPKYAKHQRAVRDGTDAGSPTIMQRTAEYLENILNLK